MKNISLFLLLFLGMTLEVASQKQNNIWYFGDNAGLDFNSGVPVPLLNGSLVTTEGCASMADANGNIIIYTEGVNVFGSNHATMPNGTGLLGGISSSQAAIILPLPGSNTLYYIFTVEQQSAMSRFCYSIVDMTLNGGLGDVTVKNTVIHTPVTEKLVATRHSNGSDFWILVHELNSNAFYTYQLSAAGVNLTPVISNVGMIHNDPIGYMKVSHNSAWASININSTNEIELFDFDNSTGIISNPIVFPPIYVQPYGMEFSPDNSKLYVCEAGNQAGPVDIYQFDLQAGSGAAILASAINIGGSSNPYLGPLQVGPDCKIYVGRYNSEYVGVINDPNQSGVACNFVDSGVYLGGRICRYGLPNQISTCSGSIFADNFCSGDSTHFNILNTFGLLGVQWDFGDPASGVNNVSYVNNPIHYFATPAVYQVTALLYYSAYTDTVTMPVTIVQIPTVSLGPDSSFCAGTPFTMYAGSGYNSYLWSDNSTDSTLTVTLPGTYWVTVEQGGCYGIDSIDLASAVCNVPVVNLMSSDTVFCDKNCIDFTDLSTNSPTSWQWFFPGADSTYSTGQNPSGICYNAFGSFDVTLIACNAAGCDTLFLPSFIIEYQVPPQPVIAQGHDTLYSTPAYSYAWYSTANPGNVISTNSYITNSNGGSYFVVISDSVGCQSSSAIFVATGITEALAGIINVNWDPISGLVQVNMPGLRGEFVEIKVLNMLGQEIYKTTTGEQNTMIDLRNSSGGIYFIRINTPKGAYMKQIILEN